MKEFDRFYDRMLPSLYLFALVAPNGLYTSLPTYPGVLVCATIIFCSYPSFTYFNRQQCSSPS